MTWMLEENLGQHLAGCCFDVSGLNLRCLLCALQASSRSASGSTPLVASRCGAATHSPKARPGREGLLQAVSSTGMETSAGHSQVLRCKGSQGMASPQRRCSMCGRSLTECFTTGEARNAMACRDVRNVR